MKRSSSRILTTHAGSLPRPNEITEAIAAKEKGQPYDEPAYLARLSRAVAEVVKHQAEIGIDIVDDGEYGKPSFVTYMNDRLGGVRRSTAPIRSAWIDSREGREFPEFYAGATTTGSGTAASRIQMEVTGPLTYKGMDLLQRDIANFKAALKGVKVAEAFMPAISTTNLEDWLINKHYGKPDDYRTAIADAMHQEYKAIVDAGFILQVDDPRLSSYYVMHPEKSMKEVQSWARSRVETLNYALRGIPADRIRYHTCYSINMGPRVHDMQLKDIVDVILRIRCGAFSFEASNPRHEHEWQLFKETKWPKDKILIPGVISHTTVLVEHPELVAQRLTRFASAVGRENVIAGSDCGFGTFASTTPEVHPSIVWVKLKAMVDGARIASKQLWAESRRTPKKPRAAAKRKRARGARRRAA